MWNDYSLLQGIHFVLVQGLPLPWDQQNKVMFTHLTHLLLLPHICVNEMGQHWFR